MSIRLTPELLRILQSLTGKMMLKVEASTDPLRIREVYPYVLVDWETEDIPPKKGLFGHSGFTLLKAIKITDASHLGTNWHGRYESSLERVIYIMERERKFFLRVEEDIKKFKDASIKRDGSQV